MILGVLGAVALIALLAAIALLAVRPFGSADESAHADYALTVAREGRLPTQFESVEPVFVFQSPLPQHVANHPPLYYALTGPLLAWGVDSGHLLAGYLLGRGVSVLASMATVALVAAFAHAVFRGRRKVVVVGAAALAATYPPFVAVSGVLHNDALAVSLNAAVLWLIVLVVRRGPTPRLVAALALTALAGTAVRANNAAVLLVACVAVLVAAMIHAPDGRRWRSGLPRGLGAGLIVGLTSVGGIGWFFWRNQQLYDSALGYGVLERQFGIVPPARSLWLLRHPDLVRSQLGLPGPGTSLTVWHALAVLPVVAVTAGLVLLAAAAARRRMARPAAAPDGAGLCRPTEPTVRRVLIGLFAAHLLITLVMVVRHVDAGGGAHVRYLFPLLPVFATLSARALVQLPGGRRGALVMVVVAAGVLSSLKTTSTSSWSRWEPVREQGPALENILHGLGRVGLPWPEAVLGVCLLLVAVALITVGASCFRLGAETARPTTPGEVPALRHRNPAL